MKQSNPWPDSSNIAFVEALYVDYLHDPSSVPAHWRHCFEAFGSDEVFARQPRRGPLFRPSSVFNPPGLPRAEGIKAPEQVRASALQDRVNQLVHAFRVRGHMIARVDPLGQPRPQVAELDPVFFGLNDADLERTFCCETLQHGAPLTLRGILDSLRSTYCRSIGVQFMHMEDIAMRRWLQARMEGTQNRLSLTREEQIRILTRLTDAVIFEEFIRKKFIGAKSFSLEGAESLIPLLDLAIECAGEQGIEEIVFGMAHRGRLNVLANIIGKSPQAIFREFEDQDPAVVGSGDVKYHLGYSHDWETAAGRTVHLSLCFNPSHLEFVNPVALGRMRAKQDRAGDRTRERGMVLLIHGDASFVGEGIVQETLNLSQLDAYTVGGTLHVILNNQIGYTTGPEQYCSSVYVTDVARMLQVPIFHVNGEDPEAVAQVVRLAMDFRKRFRRDVVIDLYCYRRLGHNESDEPSFTQPAMYRAIEQRKPVREGYLDHLLALGGVTREEADRVSTERRQRLEQELSEARREPHGLPRDPSPGIWKGYTGGPASNADEQDTGVSMKRLAALLEVQTQLPKDFHPHPKIERGIQARLAMARGEKPLDWSAAEALAFATLATEGVRVRLTGQDSERGTFSHRHAVLHDFEDGHTYVPLQHLAEGQAAVEIFNSPLSEAGVLGFEYGYSLDCPDGLVMWEAQFGDFYNAAQVIVDQFIASAEQKWSRLSGLVLLLPHGLEGMGAEHSSARLERFLRLGAEDNLQVVNPSTTAQYFHCLRRQALRRWRKPLVVMTPKSLLRNPRTFSPMSDLAKGRFQRVIADPANTLRKNAERVLLCSGKIYYELERKREELKRHDVAIVRVEQLYPLPNEALRTALAPYADGTPAHWVQEEPENMGAWRHLLIHWGDRLLGRLPWTVISRPAASSPASGSATRHKQEQARLLTQAFDGP